MIYRISPRTLIILSAVVSLSCTEEKIRTYRVASDGDSKEALAAPAEPTNTPTVSGALQWQVPAEWKKEAPRQFQTALFSLSPEVNVAVSSLPGEAGGEMANVNRWRGQVGLAPLEDVAGKDLGVEAEGISAKWFEVIGESDSILAAIISLPAETWFFKLNSPTAEIESRRGEFMSFLSTLHFGSEAPESAVAQKLEPGTNDQPKISLEAPDGWEKSEGNAMRIASFRIPGIGGLDGDVSVVPLPGRAGTALENVNRWRGQLKLPPLESENDPALGTNLEGRSGTTLITHMVSDGPLLDGKRKGAISTGILKTDDFTWFFKMGGDAELLLKNRAKFEAFVLSAEVP